MCIGESSEMGYFISLTNILSFMECFLSFWWTLKWKKLFKDDLKKNLNLLFCPPHDRLPSLSCIGILSSVILRACPAHLICASFKQCANAGEVCLRQDLCICTLVLPLDAKCATQTGHAEMVSLSQVHKL